MGIDTTELVLPTFFVIGASKSGTTSLHIYLNAHPEIEMTADMEPHFMIGPGLQGRLSAYADQFPGETKIRGDSSPGYAVYPRNPEAASNIAANVPEARFVYVVRDPVERCLAQYAQHVMTGQEDKRIERAIRPDDPACEYVNASRYATNLEAYLKHFKRKRILIVDQTELRRERLKTLAQIFAHVGASPGFRDDSFAVEHNVRGADNVQLPALFRGLKGGRLVGLSRRVLPARARSWAIENLRRVAGRDIRPEPSQELRMRLEIVLGEETMRFRELAARDFEHWCV